MIIDTKKRELKFYIILASLAAICFLLYQIKTARPFHFGTYGNMVYESYAFECFIAAFIGLILYRPSHFYYNDTDQVVIFKGHRLFSLFILKRTVHMELPKRKIRRARIQKKWFRDYLSITINGKKNVKRSQSIDIGLLTKTEKQQLVLSLNSLNPEQKSDENYGQRVSK
ncbi:MAG: hypothetical protein ACPGTG_08115 [Flavobacteriales bacterium]